MKTKNALFIVLLITFFASAAQVKIISPVEQIITEGQVLDLGIVGPGQKIEIVAHRESGEKNIGGTNALWDQIQIVDGSLEPGWQGVASQLYESPLKAFVIISKNAGDGTYEFQVQTVDEYEGLTPITFKVRVQVSKDVLELFAEPSSRKAGAGQPALFFIKLRNKSSASDVFEVTASGLPGAAKYTRKVFVSHNAEQGIAYELIVGEKGDYSVTLEAKSISSDVITARQQVVLVTETSLAQDARASAHGILLFPTVAQVIYALIGFLANILS